MAAGCLKYTIECISEFVTDKNCIINSQHLVEGLKISKNGSAIMYLYAPLLIKVKGGSVIIVDRFNREFTLALTDTSFNTMFALKSFLATCNCLCDDSQAIGVDTKIINQNGHGFTMPVAGFIPITKKPAGVFVVADTTDSSFLHEMFIVSIIDADNFIVQQNGFITVPAHGLTLSEYYYSNDAGGLSSFPDTEFDDVVAYIVNAECIMLIDNRPLDLTVNDEGLQLPVLTTVERDAIGAPVTGALIYNSNTDTTQVVNNAGAWKNVP